MTTMEPAQYSNLLLTSNVLAPSDDGSYSFEHASFLVPHEAIRRELTKAQSALENLDSSGNPWMASFLREWVEDFFVPLMFAHHYLEDSIFFPLYYQLGVTLPERIAEDHISLINRLNHWKLLVNQLAHAVSTKTDSNQIKDMERAVRDHFTTMRREIEGNFTEEEKFWPTILVKDGQKNWAKVEQLMVGHIAQLGEKNAVDPYRMLLCSMARAMGIVVNKSVLSSSETAWANEALQGQFIKLYHSLPIKAWYGRYLSYHGLLQAIMNPVQYDEKKFVVNEVGKFVNKLHKKPIWVILFLALTAYYCLGTGPYYGANSFPLRNLPALHIKIVNYDVGNQVGNSFMQFLQKVESSSDTIPTFRYEKDLTVSVDEYKQRVMDGEAWGAIFVMPNATAQLHEAIANGCDTAATYHAKSALYFAWDEGRNNQVATPQIAGFSRGILGQYSTIFASTLLSHITNETIASCIQKGYSSLLITPVSYTESNMSPVSISLVAVAAITIGNILMAVFGSLFIVNGTMNGTEALVEDHSPKWKIIIRCGTMALIGLGIAVSYATFVVGLTKAGSGDYIYTGSEWAQIVAIQWLHVMIWSFFHGFVFIQFGPGYVPFSFGLLLLYSIVGGWNTDLADQGYKAFFQIFPFHWSIYVLRYIFFKSLGFRRRISCGILIAYWICSFAAFVYVQWKKETDHLADKTAVLHSVSEKSTAGLSGMKVVTVPVNAKEKGDYEMVKRTDENVEL